MPGRGNDLIILIGRYGDDRTRFGSSNLYQTCKHRATFVLGKRDTLFKSWRRRGRTSSKKALDGKDVRPSATGPDPVAVASLNPSIKVLGPF